MKEVKEELVRKTREEKQNERQRLKDEVEMKIRKKQAETELSIKLEKEKFDMKMKVREFESKIEREKRELDILEKEIEMKSQEVNNKHEHEIHIEKIRQQAQNERQSISQTSSNTSLFQTDKIKIDIPMLKSLDLKQIDEYLERFERAMQMSDIPNTEWGEILTSKLDTQFNMVINSIPHEDMKKYGVIVQEIRKQFALDASYYRNEFKMQSQNKGESTMCFLSARMQHFSND